MLTGSKNERSSNACTTTCHAVCNRVTFLHKKNDQVLHNDTKHHICYTKNKCQNKLLGFTLDPKPASTNVLPVPKPHHITIKKSNKYGVPQTLLPPNHHHQRKTKKSSSDTHTHTHIYYLGKKRKQSSFHRFICKGINCRNWC